MEHFKYTPLNLHGSQELFTGRTHIISEILENIFEGRSVAIFGERQIGKTLLLWMIRDIVNANLKAQELIDEKLKAAIVQWNSQLHNYTAVLINLEICGSNETKLVDHVIYKFKKDINISFQNKKKKEIQESLAKCFDILEKSLPGPMNVIVLMDEMECLEDFENCQELSGIMRDASNFYRNIKFIHTGSYHWEERIKQMDKESPWRNLGQIYLGGIDENDARDYLIHPLAKKFNHQYAQSELADKIVEWSGCKPLLIQEIGRELYKFNKLPDFDETETHLLKCDNVTKYIKQSIFEEENLERESQCILKFISHYPLTHVDTISKRLKLKKGFVRRRVEDFDQDHFDTIRQENQYLRINGKLIERIGKKYNIEEEISEINEESPRQYEPPKTIRRWLMVVALLLIPVFLFFYTHPPYKTERFFSPKIKIIAEMPTSLEEGEEGNLNLSIKNLSQDKINSIKLTFDSDAIDYLCNGNNMTLLTQFEQGESRSIIVKYRVRPTASDTLNSKIRVAGDKESMSFDIKKRIIPIKKYYVEFISFFLAFLGLAFNIKKQFFTKAKK